MIKTRFTAVALVCAALTLPAFGAGKATVKIINQSNWDIQHIYLSPADEDEWGPDQLEDEILSKGDSLTLTNIACAVYDIKVVDEDGDNCVIQQAELCKDNSYWKITDKELAECESEE